MIHSIENENTLEKCLIVFYIYIWEFHLWRVVTPGNGWCPPPLGHLIIYTSAMLMATHCHHWETRTIVSAIKTSLQNGPASGARFPSQRVLPTEEGYYQVTQLGCKSEKGLRSGPGSCPITISQRGFYPRPSRPNSQRLGQRKIVSEDVVY